MRIVTDAPGSTAPWTGFLIASGGVKPSFDGEPDRASAWWWARLGHGRLAAFAEGPTPPHLAFWTRLVAVADAPTSQYDTLMAAAREDDLPPGPVAALALAGRGFHGQRGRPWAAPAGNLHLCAAVPVDLEAASCAPALPALGVVAVTDALAAVCGEALPARIKWINDVLVGEAKLAGVIASAQLLGERVDRVVLGIGVNVRATPDLAPTRFVPAATCLADHPAGAPAAAEPGRLVAALLAALARRLRELHDAGPQALVEVYRARCRDLGRRVSLWPDDDAAVAPLARGRVTGIGPRLDLELDGRAAPAVAVRLAYGDGQP